jgi:hypothetical protein
MNTAVHLSMLALMGTGAAFGDEVTDWNQIMLDAFTGPPAVSPPLTGRSAAIVAASVFDAVNGIERRYTPIHVQPAAPPGASERAAAVQAAYASLIRLFPTQVTRFEGLRSVSLSAIASSAAAEHSQSMERGIEWGQAVADAIWDWRSHDGFSNAQPPFTGGLAPGVWRPTPPAMAPGLAPQMAQMMPWVIATPSQFRPAGPNPLTSARYAAELNETKEMGSATSSTRTANQTLYVQFWASTNSPDFWDSAGIRLSAERQFTLLENARLLAHLNMAMADATIGCWDAKYTYVAWRPITAIRLADTDGNPETTADPGWTPLLTTPPFPEYPSAHSCGSSAALNVLAAYFGADVKISVTSRGMPTLVRYFENASDALNEVANARVFGGIHFRTACDDGGALGQSVGSYVLLHSLLPVHGMREDERGERHIPFLRQ